jgi:AraC-like DNA-binding protein
MKVMVDVSAPGWAYPRSANATRVLVEAGEELGLAASRCLAGTGLTRSDLLDARLAVKAEQELTAIRNLLHHTGGRPGLGVQVGGRVSTGMLGVWGFAMLSSTTTREIVDIAARYGYGGFSWAFLRPRAEEHPNEVRIVYADDDVPEDVRGFLTERDLTFTTTLMQQFLDRPVQIHIETTLNSAAAEAFALALPQSRIRFGMDRNVQIVDHSLLRASLPHADDYAMRMCLQQCQDLLRGRPHATGVAAAVRASILGHPSASPSLATIARERHVDPRTLRRQLIGEGTSFSAVWNETREVLATELLTTGAMTVEDVAMRMGFADASSFTRAYKRWTCRTPGAARTGPVRPESGCPELSGPGPTRSWSI